MMGDVEDRDTVFRRSDGSRWRMSVSPSVGEVPAGLILSPFGAESEGRSDLAPMLFELVGSVPAMGGAS